MSESGRFARRLWERVLELVQRGGPLPLDCAIGWTPEVLADAWNNLDINTLRDVLTALTPSGVIAIEMARRILGRLPLHAVEAEPSLARLDHEIVHPGSVDLRAVRQAITALGPSTPLAQLLTEIAWALDAAVPMSPNFLIVTALRTTAEVLGTTSSALALSCGPPTLEQIVAAIERHRVA